MNTVHDVFLPRRSGGLANRPSALDDGSLMHQERNGGRAETYWVVFFLQLSGHRGGAFDGPLVRPELRLGSTTIP